MSLTSRKHIIEEINGVRCSVIEKDAPAKRVTFLKKLLEYNGYEVVVQKNEPVNIPEKQEPDSNQPGTTGDSSHEQIIETYLIGVTDKIFNPVHAVYQRALKTFNDKIVSPAYWNQKEEQEKEIWYWEADII